MKVYNLIILFLIILSFNDVLAQSTLRLMESGKTKFRIGEPVIINLIFRNEASDKIVICNNPGFLVYSYTHATLAHKLEQYSPSTNFKRRDEYSTTEYENPLRRPFVTIEPGCKFEYHSNIYVNPKEDFLIPVLLNDTGPDSSSNFGTGKYKFLLPVGKYRLDVSLMLADGNSVESFFDFEIIESDESFKIDFKEYGNDLKYHFEHYVLNSGDVIYDKNYSRSFHSKLLKDANSTFTDKVLISFMSHGFANRDDFDFFVNNIYKCNDENVLYYLLYSLSEDVVFIQKRYFNNSPIEVYDNILKSLKNKDSKFSEYFISRLKANYEDDRTWLNSSIREYGVALEKAQLNLLTNYSRSKNSK